MNLRGLVIVFAYHFPPENAIGGLRPYRFCKYLSRLGYRCFVLTAAPQNPAVYNDAQFIPDPFHLQTEKGWGWQMERAVRMVLLPGITGLQWSQAAFRAARQIVHRYPDERITVFSTFPPLGPHLAAWRLARIERLPWIADFRDPLGDTTDIRMNDLHRAAFNLLERTLVKVPQAVLANTDAAAERLKTKYPAICDKVHVIPNGFDPEDRILPEPLPARKRRVLSHVGELYCGRNVTPLLESIERLITAGRVDRSTIRISLVGPVEREAIPSEDFIARAQADEWLEMIRQQIPRDQARKLSQTSDALILLQPQSAIQVPGKLFEYIQIGRPILAYIPRNSAVQRILEKSGIVYRCVFSDDSPTQMDDTVSEFWRILGGTAQPSAWFEQHFNAQRQTAALDRLITELTAGERL